MSQFQIECTDLSKRYFNKYALSNINLHVDRNELLLIKGRSGAGKSTLLSLMCGLNKPTSGKVTIENQCISELPNCTLSNLLLNQIGIIFQNFNLLPTYNIYENIEIALAPKGFNTNKIRRIVMPLLEQFQLAEKALLFPSDLSAGQQQKIAIIRTLVKEPSIIFADEPTGSVDDKTAGEIIQHLLYLKKEKKVTIVITSHGCFPETYADRIINIENGQIKNY